MRVGGRGAVAVVTCGGRVCEDEGEREGGPLHEDEDEREGDSGPGQGQVKWKGASGQQFQ